MAGPEYRYAVTVLSRWPTIAAVMTGPVTNMLSHQFLLTTVQVCLVGAAFVLLIVLLSRHFPARQEHRLTLSDKGISSSTQPRLNADWSDIRQLEFAAYSASHPHIQRTLRIQLHDGRQDSLRLGYGRRPFYTALDGAPDLEAALASLWGKPIPFIGQGAPRDDLGRYGYHVGFFWLALVLADIVFFARLTSVGGWLGDSAIAVALSLGLLASALTWLYMRGEQPSHRLVVSVLMWPVAGCAFWLLLLGTTLNYAPRQPQDFTAGGSNPGWQLWQASNGSYIGAGTRHPQPSGSHRRMAVCQGPFGLTALRYDQLP